MLAWSKTSKRACLERSNSSDSKIEGRKKKLRKFSPFSYLNLKKKTLKIDVILAIFLIKSLDIGDELQMWTQV